MVKSYPDKYAYEGFNDFLLCWLTLYRVVYGKTNLFLTEQRISPTNLLLFFLVRSQWVLRVYLFYCWRRLQNGRLFGLLIYAIVYGLFLLYFDGIIYYAGKKKSAFSRDIGHGVIPGLLGIPCFFALVSFLYPVLLLLLFLRLMKLVRTK